MLAALGGGGNKGNTLVYIKNRTKSLLLPYIIWASIILPYLYEHSRITDCVGIFTDAFVPPYGGYWFLLYLYLIQLLYCFILYIQRKCNWDERNGMFWTFYLFVISSLSLFMIYTAFTSYLLLFLLGYLGFRYGQMILFHKYFHFIMFVLFVILVTLFIDSKETMIIPQFFISLAASILILNIARSFQPSEIKDSYFAKNICIFGKYSLEIYLLHYFFVWVCRGITIPVGNIHAIPLYVMVFLFSFIICYLCCATSHVLKRIPYVALLLFGNRN